MDRPPTAAPRTDRPRGRQFIAAPAVPHPRELDWAVSHCSGPPRWPEPGPRPGLCRNVASRATGHLTRSRCLPTPLRRYPPRGGLPARTNHLGSEPAPPSHDHAHLPASRDPRRLRTPFRSVSRGCGGLRSRVRRCRIPVPSRRRCVLAQDEAAVRLDILPAKPLPACSSPYPGTAGILRASPYPGNAGVTQGCLVA